MKNITRKIIAVAALLCVAASVFTGCSSTSTSDSDSGNGSDQKISVDTGEAVVKYPFEVGSPEDSPIDAPDLNEEDPTQPVTTSADDDKKESSSTTKAEEDTTEVVKVTDEKGQPATIVVQVTKPAGQPVTEANGQPVTNADGQAVTEAGGEPVTDAKGEPVTEIAEVTAVVTKATGHTAEVVTKPTEANEKPAETQAQNQTENSYKSKQDARYAMWLDISKDKNFKFEGDFIKMKYKIKDDIPDGDYKIRIAPDLSDIAGVAVNPGKVIDGIIRVNNGSVESMDVSSESADLVFYVDNVEAKQGDTIECCINVKNNTGLAAFNIWMYFDSNAMEFIEAVPCGEFEEIANGVSTGEGGNAN